MLFINVWYFVEIPLTIIKLQSGHEITMQMIKGKYLKKNMYRRVMVLVNGCLDINGSLVSKSL